MILGRTLGWNRDLNTALYEEEMVRIIGGRKGRIVIRSTSRPPSMETSSPHRKAGSIQVSYAYSFTHQLLFNGGETSFEESAFVKYLWIGTCGVA